MVSKLHKCFIQLCFSARYCDQAVEFKKNLRIGQKLPFLGQFLMFFEIISIINDWSQLMTLHLNSTKFLGNFDTSYSSGPVLIRNLILSIEIVLYGKILSEKSLCEGSQHLSDTAGVISSNGTFIPYILRKIQTQDPCIRRQMFSC